MSIRRLLLLWLLCLSLAGAFVLTTACSSDCTPGFGTECCQDSDCPDLFGCGPSYLCTRRCFAGKSEGCSAGTVCNSTGTGCVPRSEETQPTDAGTPEK